MKYESEKHRHILCTSKGREKLYVRKETYFQIKSINIVSSLSKSKKRITRRVSHNEKLIIHCTKQWTAAIDLHLKKTWTEVLVVQQLYGWTACVQQRTTDGHPSRNVNSVLQAWYMRWSLKRRKVKLDLPYSHLVIDFISCLCARHCM